MRIKLLMFFWTALHFVYSITDNEQHDKECTTSKIETDICPKNTLSIAKNACPFTNSFKTDFNDDGSNPCKLCVTETSRAGFIRKYNHLRFSFAILQLLFYQNDSNPSVPYTDCVVQPLKWVWTHKGTDGAYTALFWPHDFNILSLGTLQRKVYGPYCVHIVMKGNCSKFAIGAQNTTISIVRALSELVPEPKALTPRTPYVGSMEDNSSVWCYTKKSNMSVTMELFCKYMVCPYETVGYSCCTREYNHTQNKWIMSCSGIPYHYSKVWWKLPFFIGTGLFLWFPLLLISFSQILYTRVLRCEDYSEDSWIKQNHLSFMAVLCIPFQNLVKNHPVAASRIIRIIATLLSLLITGLQLFITSRDHDFVAFIKDLASRNVPTGLQSILAGKELSQQSFLTIFGGPYVAFGLFLILFASLLTIPETLPTLLESGLPDSLPDKSSPLCISIGYKAVLGSSCSFKHDVGYRKIYKTMVAQCFMIINPNFWKFIIKAQYRRWINFHKHASWMCRMFPLYLLTFSVYVIVCVIEWLVSIVYHGLPVVFFNITVYRAYCLRIRKTFQNTSGNDHYCFVFLLILVMAVILLYCSYILHIIFVNGFVFLIRTLVFTYTGFVAYPEHYRNYLICYLSVAIYVVESIRSMKLTYDELFDKTKLVCEIMADDAEYDTDSILEVKGSDVSLSLSLYKFVVDHHKPLRIEMFLMVYKLLLTVIVIFMSVYLLDIFDTFDHMNILTEIGTTVVICMAPNVLRKVCKCSGYRQDIEERKTIKLWIIDYLQTHKSDSLQKDVAETSLTDSMSIL